MSNMELVPFHDYVLQSWKDENSETIFIALRPLVEALGLDWASQFKRLQRSELFADSVSVVIMTTEKGEREAVGITLDMLPMFLARIEISRAKDSVKSALLLFQKECAKVLADYWLKKQGVSRLPMTTAQMLLEQAKINVEFEKRQIAIEARQEISEKKLDALVSRQPPKDKSTVIDWLRRYSKPQLNKQLMRALHDACRDREEPEKFRPDGCDYPFTYYSPYTIAAAYDEVTRQLSFLIREKRQRRYGGR